MCQPLNFIIHTCNSSTNASEALTSESDVCISNNQLSNIDLWTGVHQVAWNWLTDQSVWNAYVPCLLGILWRFTYEHRPYCVLVVLYNSSKKDDHDQHDCTSRTALICAINLCGTGTNTNILVYWTGNICYVEISSDCVTVINWEKMQVIKPGQKRIML